MIIIVPRNSATQFGLDILFEITSNYPNKFWQQKSQGYPIYPIHVIRFPSPQDNLFGRPVIYQLFATSFSFFNFSNTREIYSQFASIYRKIRNFFVRFPIFMQSTLCYRLTLTFTDFRLFQNLIGLPPFFAIHR